MAAKGALVAAGTALLLVGAAAFGWGITRKREGTRVEALQRVAALVDSSLKERRAQVTTRAESTAVQTRLRAAIGSDAATLEDLIDHGDLALPPPDEGEVLELGQIFEGRVAPLLRRPQDALRPSFLETLSAEELRDAGSEVLTLAEPAQISRVVRIVPSAVDKASAGYRGYFVATRRLELSAAIAELATLGVAGQLVMGERTAPLGPAPAAGAALTKLAIASEPRLELRVAAVPAVSPPMAPMAGGGAAAALGLVLMIVGMARTSRPRSGAGGFAAGTPAPLTEGSAGSVTVLSGPAPSASVPLQVGAVIGRWELLRRLGSGGMADVHLARARGEAGFEKLVALKVMHPFLARSGRAVEHFLDEARVAAQIVHPNVVQIYDLGKNGDDYVIVMEYVDGANLDTLMTGARAAGRPVPLPVALGILRRMCDGLTAAHRAVAKDGTPLSIVHRDVKSGNVLVSRQGVVKVVDFGIAKAAQQSHVTMAGETKGTPSMMAPEQRVGDVVDVRADVYSSAAVGYELLTGAQVNLDLAALAHLGTEGWPHLPLPSHVRSELPRELDDILLAAMSFERERRPADCAALEAAFETVAKRYQLECSDKDIARWVQRELSGDGAPTRDLPELGRAF